MDRFVTVKRWGWTVTVSLCLLQTIQVGNWEETTSLAKPTKTMKKQLNICLLHIFLKLSAVLTGDKGGSLNGKPDQST